MNTDTGLHLESEGKTSSSLSQSIYTSVYTNEIAKKG